METLRRLRAEKGLSQAKLAARADLDPSTVNQIERGVREASPATLRKLAGALDVSLAELIEDASPKASGRSSLEPSLLNGLKDERRIPPLRSWTTLVNRLADRWEREATEFTEEWEGASAPARQVKRLPNYRWTVEVNQTAADVVEAASGELEAALGSETTPHAIELYTALRRLDKAIDQPWPWLEDPGAEKVADIRQARRARAERMQRLQELGEAANG